MSIFSALAFWKKKEKGESAESKWSALGETGAASGRGYPQPTGFDERPFGTGIGESPAAPQAFGMARDRDTELVLSKLDAIRAMLQSLDQRIASLERIAGAEEQAPGQQKRKTYY